MAKPQGWILLCTMHVGATNRSDSPVMASHLKESIFESAILKQQSQAEQEKEECTLLFVGPKGSGKTTLINAIKRGSSGGETTSGAETSTTALSYSHFKLKDITVNTWELGTIHSLRKSYVR